MKGRISAWLKNGLRILGIDMTRRDQFVLILSTGLVSWLGMQAIHEAGHVLGAGLTGGRVARVVLHPTTISRTDLAENPHPLVVVWAGPVLGAAVPLLLWGVMDALKQPSAFVLRFFAGFCLVANGAYIAGGSFAGIGDCSEMLRHGSPRWTLWLFGIVTVPVGFWLWHRQGSYFGLGTANGEVDRGVMYGTAVVALSLLALGFVVGGQ